MFYLFVRLVLKHHERLKAWRSLLFQYLIYNNPCIRKRNIATPLHVSSIGDDKRGVSLLISICQNGTKQAHMLYYIRHRQPAVCGICARKYFMCTKWFSEPESQADKKKSPGQLVSSTVSDFCISKMDISILAMSNLNVWTLTVQIGQRHEASH